MSNHANNPLFIKIRGAFQRTLEAAQSHPRPALPPNEAQIEHPEVFWSNYSAAVDAMEDSARVAAYDAAAAAASHAAHTQDLLKVQSMLRRAGVVYEPGKEWVIDGPTEDTETVVRRLATAYLK